MRQLTILLLFCFITVKVFSQSDGRKNTVYINLTNPLIFGDRAYIFGYERTIGKHQSFTFNIGRMSLPAFGGGSNNDSLKLVKNSNNKGFHISADYRFYLSKENKYDAPRGVYIGPFYSFNSFSRSNEWLLNSENFDGNVNTNLKLSFHTVGAELGYQFILWKRVALDLVLLGPGLATYKIKADLNTTLSADEESLFFEQLNGYLEDKIPGYNLVIEEGEFQKKGSVRTTTAGFRYMINIGFRF
jgi:Protein of unknown function (DUF3575)